MSYFETVLINDSKVDACVEDMKLFIGVAFVIITADSKGNPLLVTSIDSERKINFFSSSLQPREDCKTLGQLAALRLREKTRNMVNLSYRSCFNLYRDVEMLPGIYQRIYCFKIKGISRSTFHDNKKLIDRAHGSKRFVVPPQWHAVDQITHLPISWINFGMLVPEHAKPFLALQNIENEKVLIEKKICKFLHASQELIKMLSHPGADYLPCKVKVHTSKSWTNGTVCHFID